MFCKNCGNELSDDAVFCPKCGSPVKENFDLAQNKSANQKVKKEFKFSKFRLTTDFYLTIIIPILIFILSIALSALGTFVGFKSIIMTIEPFMLIASFICSLIGFVLAIVSFVNTKNPASLCSIVFVIIVVILFIVSIRLGLKMAEAEGIL